MKEVSYDKKATYHRTTHPAVMTCSFLVMSAVFACCVYFLGKDSFELWQLYFVYTLLWTCAAFYATKWAHDVHLTSQGVCFYRFGKIYRKLLWNEIIQVGIAKEYKATQLTIVLTPINCPKFESQFVTTTVYVERYRNQLIMLDATQENIDSVRYLYGEFDYDANRKSRNQ